MKILKVEQHESKENMKTVTLKGYCTEFPETRLELVQLVTKMSDEQSLTCLSLLKTQTLVFLRPRLKGGETVKFTEALELEKRSGFTTAIKQIEKKIFTLLGGKNPDMTQVQELLQKKVVLEEKQDVVKAKKAAKKAAAKATKDSSSSKKTDDLEPKRK